MDASRQILGKSKSVRDLLSGKKYTIDYYQREFKWGEKQIKELINDLTNAFFENYEEGHIRKEVANYSYYFLGSIIISIKNGQSYIIDGQQRLTSLTLLLIYLNNLQKNLNNNKTKIDDLIYSEKYGEKSFNINIEERIPCMEQLFEEGSYESDGDSESVENIARGYEYINETYPKDLQEDILLYFIDWLIDNVILVEITAYSDQDAYRVFETMNDRGLSLTPTEMLKGHLLSNIRDESKKNECNSVWKNRIKELIDIEKDNDADFIKAWLRSQYANSIRERKKGAQPMDYDKIGTEFHRWVRDNQEDIGLKRSDDFAAFIHKNYNFYSDIFLHLLNVSREFDKEYEHLFYISQIGFTLQYQVILAPIKLSDSEDIIKKKIRITSLFLDILLHRRLWNFRSIDYSTMSYHIFTVMKDIRKKRVKDVAAILKRRLMNEEERFIDSGFSLHMMNKKHIKNILARITAYIEEQSGQPSHYLDYISTERGKRYEIEHIWANRPERHRDEFESARDFEEYRNYVGGLLLLPKQFNASYGDMTYKRKLPHYYGQNLLAQSLHEKTYDHNPGFLKFIKESGLPFKSYADFKTAQLDERHALYESLADKIWNPELIEKEI